MTEVNLNGSCHPARRERADASGAERLENYAAALERCALAADACGFIETALKAQEESFRIKRVAAAIRQSEALRQGQRRGEGVHGQDPQNAEVTP